MVGRNELFFSMGRLENQPNKSRGSLGPMQKQLRLTTLKPTAMYLLSGVCESKSAMQTVSAQLLQVGFETRLG